MANTEKLPALKLSLGGAPNTPHFIVGLPGFYFPDTFTPVGGEGELTLEEAQAASEDPGLHVELHWVKPRTLERARKRQEELRGAAIRASRELAREDDVSGFELEQARDQIAAANGETDPAALGGEPDETATPDDDQAAADSEQPPVEPEGDQ